MPHPPELIESIKYKLVESYKPDSGYRYSFEKKLDESDKLIYPDIIIRDDRNRCVCVVEIGYTRPEKLAEYKRLKIPDIRWYSKSGDLFSNISGTISRAPLPIKAEVFHYLLTTNLWECDKCWADLEGEYDCWEELSEESSSATYTHLWVSDYNKALAVSYCDECCSSAVNYSNEDFEMLAWLGIADFHEFKYQAKKQPFDIPSFWLSTPKQVWDLNIVLVDDKPTLNLDAEGVVDTIPSPPTNCSYEKIEEFITTWFPETNLDYTKMSSVPWENTLGTN